MFCSVIILNLTNLQILTHVYISAPLKWLYGHVTAPYKLSYYYYLFILMDIQTVCLLDSFFLVVSFRHTNHSDDKCNKHWIMSGKCKTGNWSVAETSACLRYTCTFYQQIQLKLPLSILHTQTQRHRVSQTLPRTRGTDLYHRQAHSSSCCPLCQPKAWIHTTFNILYDSLDIQSKQEVTVIWQNAPHGGPIPPLRITPGGRNLYHWIPGVGVPISVQ